MPHSRTAPGLTLTDHAAPLPAGAARTKLDVCELKLSCAAGTSIVVLSESVATASTPYVALSPEPRTSAPEGLSASSLSPAVSAPTNIDTTVTAAPLTSTLIKVAGLCTRLIDPEPSATPRTVSRATPPPGAAVASSAT
eukprot:scaffold21113_cov81-Phaeocystis_antarctica.AAC.1